MSAMLPLQAPDSAKLMLIDTYGLVYRAFFALPMLTTSHGVPINAAYGFTMMLSKIIADEKPTHVIAAFDKGLPAARIARYPLYKAQREETPDDLRSQFALVRKILAAYAIPIVEVDGEEADDVIATLARQAEVAQQSVAVVTGDLDLLQIVDERTTVLTTRRGITELGRYDIMAVRARFDLDPRQLPDYRGLKGDPSDNLPGIPGVGEKTAIKLIKSAGSLDALLADPRLAGSPKLEKLIVDFGEQARSAHHAGLVGCAVRTADERCSLPALPRTGVQNAPQPARTAGDPARGPRARAVSRHAHVVRRGDRSARFHSTRGTPHGGVRRAPGRAGAARRCGRVLDGRPRRDRVPAQRARPAGDRRGVRAAVVGGAGTRGLRCQGVHRRPRSPAARRER